VDEKLWTIQYTTSWASPETAGAGPHLHDLDVPGPGWEPFAVTHSGHKVLVWWRKVLDDGTKDLTEQEAT
jgi:hypothetical protein